MQLSAIFPKTKCSKERHSGEGQNLILFSSFQKDSRQQSWGRNDVNHELLYQGFRPSPE